MLHDVTCHVCQKPLRRSNKDYHNCKSKLFFCGHSHRQSYLNTLTRSRLKPTGACVTCNLPIAKRHKYCIECRKTCGGPIAGPYSGKFLEARTLGEIKARNLSQKSNRYTQIRDGAKTKVKNLVKEKNLIRQCECGYSKFVDLAHIKGIASFPNETLISEINDISNLTWLCPTHHTEFDNDVLGRKIISIKDLCLRNEPNG